MALLGKIEKEKDANGDTTDKDNLVITVTNGTLQQLKELAIFLRDKGFPVGEKDEDLSEVIRIGLSFLLNLKDTKDKTLE
jgi:hypothetical protein